VTSMTRSPNEYTADVGGWGYAYLNLSSMGTASTLNVALRVSTARPPLVSADTIVASSINVPVALASSSVALPVSVTAWPAPTLGVSVLAGVSNLTVTAVPAMGFTWTVSIPGTVQANIASAPAQNVTVTAVSLALPVSITAWPAATQPVSITAWPASTLGVSVLAGVSNLTVTAAPATGFTWTVSNPGVVAPVGTTFSITCTACPVPQISAGNVLRYTATYFNIVTGTSKYANGGAQAMTMPALVNGAQRFVLFAMFSVSATGGSLIFKSQGYTTDGTTTGTIQTWSTVASTGSSANARISVFGTPNWINNAVAGTNITGVNQSTMPAGLTAFNNPFAVPNWSFDGSTQTLDWVIQRWDLWVYY
jgi:hypothetical protein